MKGNPVGESKATCASPRQNRVATKIPKPSAPFSSTETSMLLGITIDAFSISSASGS